MYQYPWGGVHQVAPNVYITTSPPGPAPNNNSSRSRGNGNGRGRNRGGRRDRFVDTLADMGRELDDFKSFLESRSPKKEEPKKGDKVAWVIALTLAAPFYGLFLMGLSIGGVKALSMMLK